MRILLVEPDRLLGETYSRVLSQAGHKVSWQRSGQAAIDALDVEIPDLILLEIQLGTHNGIELLYEMRSYSEWLDIPVVVHTLNAAVSDDVFGPALDQLGVRTVLYKPQTTNQDLLRAIRNVLEHAV